VVAEVSQIFHRDTHFYQYDLAMRATDVTGGKPIATILQSISSASAVNPLVALFYPGHHTRHYKVQIIYSYINKVAVRQ
jgi:hypothetical protein